MPSSPREIIIAADFGGTKGDLLLVDAESGAFIRRIQESSQSIPQELLPHTPLSRGFGRTVQMGNYCLEKALESLSPAKVYLISAGLRYDKELFDAHGVQELIPVVTTEVDGIMAAEQCTTGICCILGTGATMMIYQENKPSFLIDARGPICGDWGSGFNIGFTFVRSVLRKQNFTHEELWETSRIQAYLEEQMEKGGFPFERREGAPASLQIVLIFLERYDRTFVASLAKLCDECAKGGSAIAQQVLRNAAQDVAQEIAEGAAFTAIDQLPRVPVILSGSILLQSDLFHETFCRKLSALLPNAAIRDSSYPQTYGHILRMMTQLHGGENAVPLIERFRREVAPFL